jgi:small subunit ribosomal protein S17
MEKIRQQKTGIAISRAGQQTVIVKVDTYIAHPLYKKRVRKTKRFAVHDAENKVVVGDTVLIGETRPISKTKHWEVMEIIKKSSLTTV